MLDLLLKMRLAKKAEYLDPASIKRLQKERLTKLLNHVLEKSPFYQRYYKEHGITKNNIANITLSELPTINKKIMMEHYDEFVCDPALKQKDLEAFIVNPENRGKKHLGKFQVIHTSGSTGVIGLFVYGPSDWNMLKALAVTRVTKVTINPFKKTNISFIGATDGMYAGVSLATDAPKFLFNLLPLSVNRPLEELIAAVNEFQPDVLSGYSSGNYLLAQQQQMGNISIKPKRIICSADPLTDTMRETITKTFGVAPTNFYAASESVCLAAECEEHSGLHLFTDWHVYEFVDEKYHAVKAGESGRLILTNLYNYTQPLIRYEMNDQLVPDDQPCACGSPFPKIKTISGRNEEFLWFERATGEKEYIHPIVIVEFFVPGLRKLQVVQTGKNELLLKVMIEGEQDAVVSSIRKRMDEILSGKQLNTLVSYTVEVVNELPVDPKTGKFKLVVPMKQ